MECSTARDEGSCFNELRLSGALPIPPFPTPAVPPTSLPCPGTPPHNLHLESLFTCVLSCLISLLYVVTSHLCRISSNRGC